MKEQAFFCLLFYSFTHIASQTHIISYERKDVVA